MRFLVRWFRAIPSCVVLLHTAGCGRSSGAHRLGSFNDETPFRVLAEPSYAWALWPDSAYYEGNIRIPVVFWSRTKQIGERDSVSFATAGWFPVSMMRSCFGRARRLEGIDIATTRRHGCTFTFTPHFVVRQTEHESAPVRTPTFNPTLEWNLYTLFIDRDTDTRLRALDRLASNQPIETAMQIRADSGRKLPGATLPMVTAHLRFAHYSNGQSGCSYASQSLNPATGRCEPNATVGDELNYVDGSFSLNYAEVGASYSLMRFDGEGSQRRGITGSASYKFHIKEGTRLGFGGLNDEFQREYGIGLATGSLEYRLNWPFDERRRLTNSKLSAPIDFLARQRMTFRLRAGGECSPGRGRDGKCWGEVVGLWTLPALGGMGVAGRYVNGWDYYNIAFPRQVSPRWSIGLTIDHSSAMTITRHARDRAIYGR
jgi:hypothetical protein